MISAIYQNLKLGFPAANLEAVMKFLAKALLLKNWRIQSRAIDVIIAFTN